MDNPKKQVRIGDLAEWKRCGQRIAVLTAYDATMAALLDRVGIDVLLVGDSLGMVILGYDTTVPVTMDAMVHHAAAVARGAKRALIVGDMPFLSYQAGEWDALRNAGRLMQEAGVHAVKLEGGRTIADVIRRLTEAGIPVMGHVGLTPQSVHQLGGFRMVGRSAVEAEQVFENARAVESAGAFAIVLESVPSDLAERITAELRIPTIGIGAGPHCSGQVLVSYDAFGLFDRFVPSFVKRYADLAQTIMTATTEYISDVRSGRFPAEEHSARAKRDAAESD